MRKTGFLLLAIPVAIAAYQQAKGPNPAQIATAEDHARMMKMLGIDKAR